MSVERPLWWYLPVTPQSCHETETAQELITSSRNALSVLRDAFDHFWSAELQLDVWAWSSPDEERDLVALNQGPLPPARYAVALTLLDASSQEVICQLTLSPAELRMITELDPEVGRRIGDELDGERPRSPQL